MSGLLNNNAKWPFKGYYCHYGKVCRFKHCAQHPDVDWALKLTVPMLQQKQRPVASKWRRRWQATRCTCAYAKSQGKNEHQSQQCTSWRQKDSVLAGTVEESDTWRQTAMPKHQILQRQLQRKRNATTAASSDTMLWIARHQDQKKAAKMERMEKAPLDQKRAKRGKAETAPTAEEKARTKARMGKRARKEKENEPRKVDPKEVRGKGK